MAVYKFSNVSGFKNYQKYNDFLAGNPAVVLDKGSMFPLGVFTLSSAQTAVEFTNIPQTYTHLQVRLIARSTTSAASANSLLQLNGNTGSNYAAHVLRGDGGGGTPTGAAYATQTFVYTAEIPAATATAGIFGPAIIDILDYKSTAKNKTIRQFHGNDRNGAGAVVFASGLFYATPAAVTSIKFTTTGDFAANSSFALYGVL